MANWLKKILGGSKKEDSVKNFEAETSDLPIEEYRKVGKQSIKTSKIVGSVGRSHELDGNFEYRGRAKTSRYRSIEDASRQGKPMDPIKVLKVKRDRNQQTEFYVMDGHHRVAHAKKKDYDEMNAEVTEVILPEDDTSEQNES